MLEPNFTKEQIDLLNTPPSPDEIEKKQGLSYLKGQAAIVKANRIFGIGNWSYKQVGPIEITDTGINNGKGNRIYLVSATVELTVRGCETFIEQGDCEAQGMGAPSISMARKGAVTDGVKRCLKNYGPAFGLNLYFDHPDQASSEPAQPQPQPLRQQAPAQATSRPVTPGVTRMVNPMPHTSNAPQNAPKPVTTPQPILSGQYDDDENFKTYKKKIQDTKSLKELSDLGPEMRRQVVDQRVLVALGKEYTKRENILLDIENAKLDKFAGSLK